jgi:PKD repeat protein
VKDGYDSASQTVTLAKGDSKTVPFTLVQQAGTLEVTSIPSAARILLNGTDTTERTDFTFTNQPVGTYNVTVVKDGYDSASQTVTLEKGDSKTVPFTLVQHTGTLEVTSIPSAARILLNGTDTTERTDFTFTNQPVGTYYVTVVKSGYDTQSETVTLAKGDSKTVPFTLVQQVGTLEITSIPSAARIFLNGTDTENLTNFTFTNQPVGTYNVTVVKSGYDTQSDIVTLAKGDSKTVPFTLVPHTGSLHVSSTPVNASIWLDGENTNKFTNATLLTVPVGIHEITVEKPGFVTPVTESITVKKDEVTDVFFALIKTAGKINVTSSPDEAWIWLDGGNTTVLTNNTLSTIPVGSHDIQLVKSLYHTTPIQNVMVSENQTADVSFTLTPIGSKPAASFTAHPRTGDAPLPVTFTDTSTGDPDTWNWSFGDGHYSDVQNPVHTYINEGAYDVTLTAGNSYGTDTVTETDYCIVSGRSAILLSSPSGRIPAGNAVEFSVTADGLDNTTELNFSLTFDPALVTVENVTPALLVQGADFRKTMDNTNGRITVNITDDTGLTSRYAAPIADITFKAADTITGLRQTTALVITDADAQSGECECPINRLDGNIAVEARTVIALPNDTLPAASSKYLTVSASNLNEVKNVSFIMEFNRTVMSVTDIRANGTVPGLLVSSVIRNENGWLEVNAESLDTITGPASIPLVDISVHSNGLPGEYDIRLVNPSWTRDNTTYPFDDLHPVSLSITPVPASLTDNQPVTISNLTFNDDTRVVSINLTENQNATITGDNTTIYVRNPGIDILIQTSGMENRSSAWTGVCTGAEIKNISRSVDLNGDVGAVSTGISAHLSGSLSALMNPDTGLDFTITRGAVNETMGQLFQVGVLNLMDAELKEVACTMEINTSAFGGITVSDAVMVMSAPEWYVNTWGGAQNFTILSMNDGGEISLLATTYTYADGIFTFTALSPDAFSFKSLVSFTVNNEPVSAFSATPVAGDAPLSVQFNDYSGGYPDSWLWDFGDGSTSTDQHPAHLYTAAGVYDVSLSITNVIGADTMEKTGYITVTNPMRVDFTATPVWGYAPLAVTFTDETVGNPTAWLWDFGDGETSAERNPVHTYQRAGAYTVSLTTTNAYGNVTTEKANYVGVRYYSSGSDTGNSVPARPTVTPTPTLTPTSTPTPPQPTVEPTPEPTMPVDPTPSMPDQNEFTGTAQLPVSPTGTVEQTVTLWADDQSGYLTIDAGVLARDASGDLQETISIVAVPVTSIPPPGTIGSIELPGMLYAFECSPDGTTFSPAVTLTFVLTEEEWEKYGPQAEIGWYNSESGEWETITGVANADQRTITIEISHFSTYALFAKMSAEVPLPDMTNIPGEPSGGTSLWLWGGLVLIIALGVVGYLVISKRKNE